MVTLDALVLLFLYHNIGNLEYNLTTKETHAGWGAAQRDCIETSSVWVV